MTQAAPPRDGVSDLRRAIAQAGLSEPLKARAQAILDQIERPVRLAMFGLPGSGKSQILNFLAGADVLPGKTKLPTLQLSYGDAAVANCTLPDGTVEALPMEDMQAITALKPVFVDAEMPLPALKKISILEVSAGASLREQQRAMSWASKRSDVALWCSKGAFGRDEQALWAQMPAALQDHAFLLMTHDDNPAVEEAYPGRVDRAVYAMQDQFRQVLPIGTKTAIAARNSDGTVNKDMLRSSGGMAVISAILRMVETGHQGARDQADIFLRQIAFDPEAHAPAPVAPPAPIEAPVEAAASRSLGPASREACEQAVAQLTAEGTMMGQALSDVGLNDGEIVDICVDTVVWLSDYLAESGEPDDPAMAQLRETAMDAADLVQLIQLETSETVASDSVSVMVQVKQEMQQMLAS